MSDFCVVCCDSDTDHSLRDSQSMDVIPFLDRTYYGGKVFVIYDVRGLAVPTKMLSMKHRCSVSYQQSVKSEKERSLFRVQVRRRQTTAYTCSKKSLEN